MEGGGGKKKMSRKQTSLTDFFGSRRRSSSAATAAAAAAMPAKRLKLRGPEGGFHFSGGGGGGGCGGDAVEAKALSDVVVFSGTAAAAAAVAAMAASTTTTTTTRRRTEAVVAVSRARRARQPRETKAATEEGRTRLRGDVATSRDDDHHHRGERRRRPRRLEEVEEVEVEEVATIATPSSEPRQLRAARRREGEEVEGEEEEEEERRGGGGGDERRVMVLNDVVAASTAAIATAAATTRRRRRLGEQQRKRGDDEEEEEGGRRGDGCGEDDDDDDVEKEEEVGHGESPVKRSRETPRGVARGGREDEDGRGDGCGEDDDDGDEEEDVGRRAARKRLQLGDEPGEKEGSGDECGDGDGDTGDAGTGDGDAGTGDGDAGYPPVRTAGLRKSVKEQLNRRLSLSPAWGGPKASPKEAPPTPQEEGGCPGGLQVAQKANAAEVKQSLGTCSSLAELQAKIRRIQQKKKQQEEAEQQQQSELERKAQGNAGTLTSRCGRDLDSAELKAAVERARSARALASRLLDRRSLAPPAAAPATPPPCVRPLRTTTPTTRDPALHLARTTPDSGENVPAFERFHTLAQDAPPGLTLPLKMTLLAEMFRSMDTVVGMLFNRTETVTFAKVQSAVHEMLRRRFEERSVGQIHAVYPEAYRFRQERAVVAWSHSARPGDYHLTIEPLLPTGDTTQGSRPHLTAARLLERRRSFHRRLLAIVKKHHKAFLESLSPPMSVPEERLARWHPRFDVDAVPDVTPAPLPRPPEAERCSTAGDALRMARGGGGVGGLTPKMEKALANVALKSSGATPGDRTTGQTENRAEAEATPGPAATLSPALKGISQSLIDRVRAREAARAAACMQRDAGAEERAGRLRRLPAVARTLRGVFLAERRPALPMELACSRLVQSCGLGTTAGEMEQLLRLLADAAPRWLGLVTTARGDLYVKLLDKSADLSLIATQLQERARQEQATL